MSNKLNRKHRRELKRRHQRKLIQKMKQMAKDNNAMKDRDGLPYQKAPIDPVGEFRAAKERKRELEMTEIKHRRANTRRNHL